VASQMRIYFPPFCANVAGGAGFLLSRLAAERMVAAWDEQHKPCVPRNEWEKINGGGWRHQRDVV
jgi:hypothetical protein